MRKRDMPIVVIREPVDGAWLVLLAQGWRLAEANACHLETHHARYTVLLWRRGG